MMVHAQTTCAAWGDRTSKTQLAPIEAFIPQRGKIFCGDWLADIKILEKSIQKLGLLSPLLVIETRGKFRVVDGKKRLAAIRRLRFMGKLPRHLNRIPYVVLQEGMGLESPMATLLTHREIYHHVIDAYREGSALDEIAERLYLPRQSVREILTLSRLSRRLRSYFFDGHMDLDQAKAYASMPRRIDQDMVFDQVGPFACADEILEAGEAPMPQPQYAIAA